MHPTGSTGLRPGIVSGRRFRVVPSFVVRSRDWAPLPADVFGSPNRDVELGDDDMAPLEHNLASRQSLSPHPSLDATQTPLGKRSVAHVICLQAFLLTRAHSRLYGGVRKRSHHHGTSAVFGWPCSRGRRF